MICRSPEGHQYSFVIGDMSPELDDKGTQIGSRFYFNHRSMELVLMCCMESLDVVLHHIII